MQVLFVTGVDTNVGKTYISSKLTTLLQSQGFKAIAIKPIETGVLTTPLDSALHLQNAQKIFADFTLQDINLYSFALPASPFVADKNTEISIPKINAYLQSLKNQVDILIIEGAGGLFVPIYKDYFMLDWIKDLQKDFHSHTLLVCDDKLGMINRFLSAKTLLELHQISHTIFVNLQDEEAFKEISYPFLKHYQFEQEIKNLLQLFYPHC